MYVSGLGKVDNRIWVIVLEWTPEKASLLQDRPSLLHRQSTSQGNMGNSEPPDILYETCACIIHIMFIIIATLHDQSFSLISEDSLRDSKPTTMQLLGTRGPRDRSHNVSVSCACVTHTNLLS